MLPHCAEVEVQCKHLSTEEIGQIHSHSYSGAPGRGASPRYPDGDSA